MSGLLLVLGAIGCSDDGYPTADLSNLFEVMPPYIGIDQGAPQQFTATVGGVPVAVTWESSDVTRATISATGRATTLAPGFVAITATQTANPTMKKSASLTILQLFGIGMTSGVPVTGIGGAVGANILYRIFVPPGSTNLTVTMSGGTGDLDLHVRPLVPPTLAVFTCRPYLGGNNESCSFTNPQTGTWYFLLDVYTAGTGVTLVATVTPTP